MKRRKRNPTKISAQHARMARAIIKAQGWDLYSPKLVHDVVANLEAGYEKFPLPKRRKNPIRFKRRKVRARRRRRNPTKAQIRAAAARVAKSAAKLAWRATKATAKTAGRAGLAAGRSAARDVKAAICRPRGKNPRRKRTRRARRVSRGPILIRIQRGTTRLYFDGKNFRARRLARHFPSVKAASAVARRLWKHHRKLHAYKMSVVG